MITEERRAELARMAYLETHPSAKDLQFGLQEVLQELRLVERVLTEARNYAFIRETTRLLGLSLLKSLIDQNGVTIALYQIGLPLEENAETIGSTFTPAFNSVDELEEFCRTNFRRILDFADGSATPVNGWWSSAKGPMKDLDRHPAEAGSNSDGAGTRDQRERFFICARK